MFSASIPLIARISPQHVHAAAFLEQIMRPFLLLVCEAYSHQENEHSPIMNTTTREVIKQSFLKILQLFPYHQHNFTGFRLIADTLNAWFDAAHEKKPPIHSKGPGYYSHSYRQRDEFTLDCEKLIIAELSNHPKVVWGMSLPDLNDLVQFFNSFINYLDLAEQIAHLVDLYFTEIHAYFLSCRPELLLQIKK